LDPTTAASDETATEQLPVTGTDPLAVPTAAARVTLSRFLAALALACVLLFGLLVLFALTGLGILGVMPALVVAMTLTARITKIRRTGILIFLIVIVGSYAIAIAYILANPQPT